MLRVPCLRTAVAVVATLAASTPAWGFVDPKCADEAANLPADYDEQVQQDFLQNYPALYTTLSPIHGPIPHEPGHGAIGLDLNVVPPVGCSKRLVLNYTKTEDPNKTPVVPRPRITFAFPAVGSVVFYGGIGYVPPVKVFGTRNVILSGEVGAGIPIGETVQAGLRFHATSQKTVGEIATPFVDGDPAVDDLYIASTFGLDAMFGLNLDVVTPYLAAGFTDVSTLFLIGDDNLVANNFHPYFGFTGSAGVDALVAKRLRLGGEFYAAPGGISLPDNTVTVAKPLSRYGQLYTARFRIAVEL
jgi:hypothetical protein